VRILFNRKLDLLSAFGRRISLRSSTRHLLFFGIGAAVAVVFSSLCLTPVTSYAAEAQRDSDARPGRQSIAAATAGVSEPAASIDRVQPTATEKRPHADTDAPAYPTWPSAEPSIGDMLPLPGHVLSALQKARLLAPEPQDGAQPLIVTIVLKRSHPKGFERYLHDVYNPHSRRFQRFLTPVQVSNRFGPSQKSYTALAYYLEENALEVTQRSANRMTITLRATRAQLERTFKVQISEYQIGNNRFYANDRDPELPSQIASSVQAVIGLSDLTRPRNVEDDGFWSGFWFWVTLFSLASVLYLAPFSHRI
jgi:hypothetical protein